MRYYLSIEKNVEGFELYKSHWKKLDAHGIMATTMTDGIEKAIEIEKSKSDELYFIDIVADDIDYMPQLEKLQEETVAPILIATAKFDNAERTKALDTGADFYGEYCKTPEENIQSVISAINSIERRAKKQKPSSKTIIYRGIMVSPSNRNTVFVGNDRIKLTRKEFDILYYLIVNRGKVLSYKQIYRRVWGNEFEDSVREVLRNSIHRLREKLKVGKDCPEYIETVIDVGYRFPLNTDK